MDLYLFESLFTLKLLLQSLPSIQLNGCCINPTPEKLDKSDQMTDTILCNQNWYATIVSPKYFLQL